MISDQMLPAATLLVINPDSFSPIESRKGISVDAITKTDWRAGTSADAVLPFAYAGTAAFYYGNLDVFHIDARGTVWHVEARATVWHVPGRKN